MSPRHKKDAFRICVTFLGCQMEIEPGSVSVSICQFQGWWKHHLVSYQLELPSCCSNTLVTEPWSISTKLLSIAKARHVPKMRKSLKCGWNRHTTNVELQEFLPDSLEKVFMMLVAVFHPATGIYKNHQKMVVMY